MPGFVEIDGDTGERPPNPTVPSRYFQYSRQMGTSCEALSLVVRRRLS